jgi:hypothetical protein
VLTGRDAGVDVDTVLVLMPESELFDEKATVRGRQNGFEAHAAAILRAVTGGGRRRTEGVDVAVPSAGHAAAQGLTEHLLVVAHQRDKRAEPALPLRQQELHDAAAVWAAVDIVTEKDQAIAGFSAGTEALQKLGQEEGLSVDVSDGEGPAQKTPSCRTPAPTLSSAAGPFWKHHALVDCGEGNPDDAIQDHQPVLEP